MGKKNNLAVEQQVVNDLLKVSAKPFSFVFNRAFSLFTDDVLQQRSNRIIYGNINGRTISDTPKNRRGHTLIKGEPGFGKSALATNMAIQNIEQGTRVLLLDPHGNPFAKRKEKGFAVDVYTRTRDVSNLVFLTTNQKEKVMGLNPFFLIGEDIELDRLINDLMETLIYDSKDSKSKGFEVADSASFILKSVVYFHSAYLVWLIKVKRKTALEAAQIVSQKQLTINDIANLKDNPGLIDLLIIVLGFSDSPYYQPSLVRKWEKIRASEKFSVGTKGVVGRLKKVVSTPEGELFFESSGFEIARLLKKKISVICDLSNLDAFTIANISKIVLVRIYKLYESDDLWDQTELYIDEASNVEIRNLPLMLEQGRKMGLSATLIFHYKKQFSEARITNSIQNSVVTKINFRNSEPDFNISKDITSNLKKREFVMQNSKAVYQVVRTNDMPSPKRKVEFEELGITRKELKDRIKAKEENIFDYFLNV